MRAINLSRSQFFAASFLHILLLYSTQIRIHTFSKANFVGRNASYLLIKWLRHRPTNSNSSCNWECNSNYHCCVASPFACVRLHLQLAANLAGIVCSTCSSLPQAIFHLRRRSILLSARHGRGLSRKSVR